MNVVYLNSKSITFIDANSDRNGIKTFMSFTKLNGIKDYIIISSDSPCLIEHGQMKRIKNFYITQNPFLIKILKRVGDLDRPFEQFNEEEKTLFNIYHALASTTETLFFNLIDTYLTHTNLRLLNQVIKYEINNNKKNIIICSSNLYRYTYKYSKLFSLYKNVEKDDKKESA
jgi:hypothetical protein